MKNAEKLNPSNYHPSGEFPVCDERPTFPGLRSLCEENGVDLMLLYEDSAKERVQGEYRTSSLGDSGSDKVVLGEKNYPRSTELIVDECYTVSLGDGRLKYVIPKYF